MEILGTVRALIFRAGMSILILALSLLVTSAAALSFEEGVQVACELNNTEAKKASKVKNNLSDSFMERTALGYASLRAEREKTVVPAPVMVNNFGMALEEYLTVVNTLLPEPYLLQLLQPHSKPILKQANPIADSNSPAGFTISLKEEEPPLNSKYIKQRVVNRRQTRSVLYLDLDHEVRKKNQARIEI